jgi:DNA-binding MarR family transcriptional regulator/ribosomal protein S18 acetylase RimI-like enzyme
MIDKPAPTPDAHVAALRSFNRFYTRRIGVLDEHLYGTPFTLPQTRVLWELAHYDGVTASELARLLDLDAGYLSRLLATLKSKRLVRAQRSPADARQSVLTLTTAGRRAFAPMDAHSQAQVSALLAPLDEPNRRRLLHATDIIESLLGAPRSDRAPYLLRAPQPGDIGWVVARHGAIYAHEYGWDLTFEGLVACIAGRFVERFDAKREGCWIAERDGQNVGCVFVVQARNDKTDEPDRGVAQLRLLLVEPSARGLGIGARLVAECERFARQAGYRRIKLWTQSTLLAARAIYAKAGYRLVGSEPHRSFGADLIGEVWELVL